MHLVGVTLEEFYYVLLVVGVIIYLLRVMLVIINTLLAIIILLVWTIVLSCVWRTQVFHFLLPLIGFKVLRLNKLVFVYLRYKVVYIEYHLLIILILWLLQSVGLGCTVDSCDQLIEDGFRAEWVIINIVAAVIGCIHVLLTDLLLIHIIAGNKLKGLLGGRPHLEGSHARTFIDDEGALVGAHAALIRAVWACHEDIPPHERARVASMSSHYGSQIPLLDQLVETGADHIPAWNDCVFIQFFFDITEVFTFCKAVLEGGMSHALTLPESHGVHCDIVGEIGADAAEWRLLVAVLIPLLSEGISSGDHRCILEILVLLLLLYFWNVELVVGLGFVENLLGFGYVFTDKRLLVGKLVILRIIGDVLFI